MCVVHVCVCVWMDVCVRVYRGVWGGARRVCVLCVGGVCM